MKMKIHLIGLALLACSAAAQAQHDISTNFLGLLTTNYSLAYEMNIQGDMGARIESSLFTTTATVESENGDSKDFDWQGFRLTPEYRFYFSNDKPGDGFFVAPYLRYRNRTLEGDIDLYNDELQLYENHDFKRSAKAMGFGLNMGKKWVMDRGFFFELSGGIGKFVHQDISIDNSTVEDYFEDHDAIENLDLPDLRFALNIGWRIQ